MTRTLVIGRVRSTFGTAGEIKVESLSGELDHFQDLKSIGVRTHKGEDFFDVEHVRFSNQVVLMKLAGVATVDEAARLRGAEIFVSREQAAPLDKDEFYYADLVGLRAFAGGSEVGRVTAIVESGSHPLLEIETADKGSVLVPFHGHFVGEISLENGTLEIVNEELLE